MYDDSSVNCWKRTLNWARIVSPYDVQTRDYIVFFWGWLAFDSEGHDEYSSASVEGWSSQSRERHIVATLFCIHIVEKAKSWVVNNAWVWARRNRLRKVFYGHCHCMVHIVKVDRIILKYNVQTAEPCNILNYYSYRESLTSHVSWSQLHHFRNHSCNWTSTL